MNWLKSAVRPAIVATCVTTVAIGGGFLALAQKQLDANIYDTYAASPDGQISRLGDYRDIFDGQAVHSVMIFMDTPDSPEAARRLAATMAQRLKHLAAARLHPTVIIEPVSDASGQPVNFESYARGSDDLSLTTYFRALQQSGVSDSQLGKQVWFPEANAPNWGQTTDPTVVGVNIARSARIQKQFFPHSEASMMLDSQTYPSGTSWTNGSYQSLVTYVKNIPPGLIDSFGLQGFPDYPTGSTRRDVQAVTPRDYLNASLATDAAQALKVKAIWFNTGTLRTEYSSTKQQVHIDAPQRARLLQAVAQQAAAARSEGYDVEVNIFAADKTATSEGKDWSYLETPADRKVLHDFATKLNITGVKLGLYDSAND